MAVSEMEIRLGGFWAGVAAVLGTFWGGFFCKMHIASTHLNGSAGDMAYWFFVVPLIFIFGMALVFAIIAYLLSILSQGAPRFVGAAVAIALSIPALTNPSYFVIAFAIYSFFYILISTNKKIRDENELEAFLNE